MSRLLRISGIPGAYVREFWPAHRDLHRRSYDEIKQALTADHASSSGAYSAALARYGYECSEIFHNVAPLQRRWAREHGINNADLRAIVVRQASGFRPDVLWFDSPDGELIRAIRAALPKLRFVIGWEGSALSSGAAWPHVDIVLSCAPESVLRLTALGIRSKHLHHGFDPRSPPNSVVLPKN